MSNRPITANEAGGNFLRELSPADPLADLLGLQAAGLLVLTNDRYVVAA